MSESVPKVTCIKNGPYKVESLETLEGPNGETLTTRAKMVLCRCGKTGNRPYCDGTHREVGFTDDKSDGRVGDRRDTYVGAGITIHDNRGICSHAGFCTDGLAEVFKTGVEPWIDPAGADVQEIIETIRRCPSGALSYSIDGVVHSSLERPPAIRVTPHGPLRFEGGVELHDVESLDGVSTEHRTLCRCGSSKNKPFCDGSHWYANFRDDGNYRVAMLGELEERTPTAAEVEGVPVVLIRFGPEVFALSGRCAHQGALMADGAVEGDKLVCGLHGWTYDIKTGVRDGGDGGLTPFKVTVDPRWGEVLLELDQVRASKKAAETKEASGPTQAKASPEEPHNAFIHQLAEHGLSKLGAHGPMAAMGVPRYELPTWDDIQVLTAQLHRLPLLDGAEVGTELIIGPRAKKPLRLEIPIFVSDMSFGSLSQEAKVSLARGAELAGTGICSGEGGMLPEEQAENTRYFYELASARFGFEMQLLDRVQAFHFKGGQGAKTGTGGHLPGAKVTEKIAQVRGLKPGEDAISPPRFPDWESLDDYRGFVARVREQTGGIPIGFKLSAQHIEKDIQAALDIGCDYIILDGRGGGTGAAPLIFRDNISTPTLPALARARKYLDQQGASDVTLIITGGLRTPSDFVKALAMGADGIAIANSAIQAIGCIGARACNTNNCPTGVATQKPHLRKLINVDVAAKRLERFLGASVHLMATLARACGHDHLSKFRREDLTTWKRDVAHLTGVPYGGIGPI